MAKKKETVVPVLLRSTHFLNTKSMKRAKPFREHLVFLKISAMNKTLKKITTLVVLIALLGCNVGPKPIDYGQDGCYFCKMAIVDKRHAAEIITQKGKIYTFDATECMVNFLSEFDASTVKLYLSNNYSNPGELIDATQATFLISENIPSPMGAFLSAFKHKEDATKKEGDIYTWNGLLNHLKKSKINQNFN